MGQSHKLFEIVWQSIVLRFFSIINVWEVQQMYDDVIQIKVLANTKTTIWSDEFVKA